MGTRGGVSRDYAAGVISRSHPSALNLPVPFSVDHVDHVIKTALDGHTKLASDHLLHPELKGMLVDTVSSLVERLETVFAKAGSGEQADEKKLDAAIVTRNRIYDMLLETILSLMGVEKTWVGFSNEEALKAIGVIIGFLKNCEKLEKKELGEPVVYRCTIASQLERMRLVNKGNSLVAWMAKEIENGLEAESLTESYVRAVEKILNNNFYYSAYMKGLCKFGNDYALGLRWLRHLGYVQVSTNPVLAALAYEDDHYLWESFKKHVEENLRKQCPEWFSEPEKHADEIAMEATRFALLDNFYVFRVPFALSKYQDGLVSYQLNPLIADDVDKSVEAARSFAGKLENDLRVYDEYLFWGYREPHEKGRPNLVIKVAAAYPSSVEIVRRINEAGIGQNITLSFTVSQEVILGVTAMEGMAAAVGKGIAPTQTYDTNMGGRLEDHLRESVAASLLLKAVEKMDSGNRMLLLEKIADGLGMRGEEAAIFRAKDMRGKVELLTSRRLLGGSLLNKVLVETLVSTGVYGGREQVVNMLKTFEDAVRMSGTYVARRVYEIMFSPLNRLKWVDYLVRRYRIPRENAELIINRIDLLPASKRKPEDTFLTLSGRNVTNTEFPNHQLAVVKEALREGFNMGDYEDSISRGVDQDVLKVLMSIEDFVKAYEASPELNSLLKKAGIVENYGDRGVETSDWPSYGPCVKTLEEFTRAYLSFRKKVLDLVRGG
ncbi:MAG: transaldolase family protein [Thermoproteota archaeon]